MNGKIYPIDGAFSKGFVQGKTTNKIPNQYAQSLRNVRILNQALTIRSGFSQQFIDDTKQSPQGIVGNSTIGVVQGSHYWLYDFVTSTITDKGDISYTGQCNFLTYGRYNIIYTGAGAPWVYNELFPALTQVTAVPAGTNFRFGEKFAGFTVAAGSGTYSNIMYISRPVDSGNPGYIYDRTGTGSQNIVFKSTIQGFVSSLNRLFIFTEQTIEVIDRSSLTKTGSIDYLYSTPLGYGSQLASPNAIVGAGDKIFYLTKDKKIRTIGYRQGIVEPQFGDLSDIPLTGINEFMIGIADDQSSATAIFDRTRNLIKFWLKSATSTVNDLCVIYDLINECWLLDDNKYFYDVCEYKNEYYGISPFVFEILKDEDGTTDRDEPTDWEYTLTTLGFGQPNIKKQFRGLTFSGRINTTTNIYFDIIVDDDIVKSGVINGFDRSVSFMTLGIGGSPIGGQPIGGNIGVPLQQLVDFDAVITKGNLRSKGKRIRVKFYGADSLSPDFAIDFLSFTLLPLGTFELSDKQV